MNKDRNNHIIKLFKIIKISSKKNLQFLMKKNYNYPIYFKIN